jgi:uncharacterized protein YkwD
MFKWFSRLNNIQRLSVVMALIAVIFTAILLAAMTFKNRLDSELNNPVVGLLNAQKDSQASAEEAAGLELKMDKTEASVEAGKTLQLTVKIEGESSDNKVQWDSSDEKIATVDSSGLVTAKEVGIVTIRAKLNERKTAISVIKVTEPPKPEPPKQTQAVIPTTPATGYSNQPCVTATSSNEEQKIEAELFLLVNQLRADIGVPLLKSVTTLSCGSQIRVVEESVASPDHARPSDPGNQSSFQAIFDEIGYGAKKAWGENIVSGYYSPSMTQEQLNVLAVKMFNSWRESKTGHYESMVNPVFNETGIAVNIVVADGKTSYYAAQLFAQK